VSEAFEVELALPVPAGIVAEVLGRLGRITDDDEAVSTVAELSHPSGQTEIVIVMGPTAADDPLAAAARACRDAALFCSEPTSSSATPCA